MESNVFLGICLCMDQVLNTIADGQKTGDFQWYLPLVWIDLKNPTWIITCICVEMGGSSHWLFLNLLQTQQHDQDFVYTTLLRFVQNIIIFQL